MSAQPNAKPTAEVAVKNAYEIEADRFRDVGGQKHTTASLQALSGTGGGFGLFKVFDWVLDANLPQPVTIAAFGVGALLVGGMWGLAVENIVDGYRAKSSADIFSALGNIAQGQLAAPLPVPETEG